MTPVYVPYWVFQANTHTYWTADSSKTPPGASGNWYPLAGEHEGSYAAILIGAGGALSPSETHALCPFDLGRGVPPGQVDLENVTVEEFSRSKKYARPLARSSLEELEKDACVSSSVPGSARNVHVNVQVTDMTGVPALLPVWIMAYRFRDRVFRFLVNGQTGKATGQAPISYAKILGAVVIAVLAVLIVLLLAGLIRAAPVQSCAPVFQEVNSLLQKGTGSEPSTGNPAQNGLHRRASPLFQSDKPLMLEYRAILFSDGAPQPETKQSVVASGAKLKRLSADFEFTEGPTCDAQGNVFFTDQPNNRIMKWSVENKLTTFLQPAGRSNGMYFDARGNLIACADEKNELWSIAPDGRVSRLWKDYEGKPLNGPNDVWIHPGGGIYLTDPFYKRPWWQHDKPPQSGEHVYYLAPGHRKLIRVIDDLTQPNGITGTPDGKTLYVADIGAKKTYRYDIQADGKLAGKKLFCKEGSDGMTIDDENDLYLTGKGVLVFDPAGKQIEQIPVPDEPWTANVCFGGKDRQTLFVTASKGLYSIKMRVKGANPSK